VSYTYQKKGRSAQPDSLPGEIAVPEQVNVSMTEIADSAREGLLALADRPAGDDRDVRGGRHRAARAGG
jgi:hypothetical protein